MKGRLMLDGIQIITKSLALVMLVLVSGKYAVWLSLVGS